MAGDAIPVVDLTGADAVAFEAGVEIVSHVRIERRSGRGHLTMPPVSPSPMSDTTATTTTTTATADTGSDDGGDDDDGADVEVVAVVHGSQALVDLPHMRFQCGMHDFTDADKLLHCANCFCFICDVLASECTEWWKHAKATDKDTASTKLRRSRLLMRSRTAPTAARDAQTAAGNAAISRANAMRDAAQWQTYG